MANTDRRQRQGAVISWWKRKPGNTMQNLNLVISSTGGIASIILACWALALTYRFGESTEQIKILTNIALQQQSQLERLELILKETKLQNKLSDSGLIQLQSTNTKLVNQSKLLNRQVTILADEQAVSNQFRKISRKAAFLNFKYTVSLMGDLTHASGGLFTGNYMSTNRIAAASKAEKLLESQLTSTFLIEHQNSWGKWKSMYRESKGIQSMEAHPDSSWFTISIDSITNAQSIRDSDPASIRKEKITRFNTFVRNFRELYIDVLKDIVWKEDEIAPKHYVLRKSQLPLSTKKQFADTLF
ncbi:hypothetical protein IDJ77_11485 [Mucilaginibacter sp. ZT4R22]|uniref:Uncharacterized protein n=1 Tax=Mucilaginibacter pankratovii TaxID=2772110 RepID=A0ABR7WQE9_9SPHI|nr:hypothetical protein [Mucilaginibacter pankratovii]MBD1364431.1 hypothetical protein [Mucilaginibacter pankratovii]